MSIALFCDVLLRKKLLNFSASHPLVSSCPPPSHFLALSLRHIYPHIPLFLFFRQQINFWERKIQMGIEIKEAVRPKNSENCDINIMKSEIHRMTLRHSSLMKEQEKLIQSMENSVTR